MKRFLGKMVRVMIDRPMTSVHPSHTNLVYPINYGYIPGEMAPDGEEVDVCILGLVKPAAEFTGRVIAMVHREDDVEDKLVAAPDGRVFTAEEVADAVSFQEQYFHSQVIMWEGHILTDIPAFSHYVTVEPLHKGWSSDKKYHIDTASGERLLLRLADIAAHERKQAEYQMLQRMEKLCVPTSRPVDFGVCNGGKQVHQLLTWVMGKEAEAALPALPQDKQYALGIHSGEILRKIHSIPAPATQEDWAAHFNRKTDHVLKTYGKCGMRFAGDEHMIAYIQQNRSLLDHRPLCFQHGDYHVGNMIINHDERISIIDWNRSSYGDPWEEFNRIVWSAAISPPFATGQLRGYFGGDPPMAFFQLLAFYVSCNTLSSIYWAIPFGQSEIDTMMKQSQDVLGWYDNMETPVPSWYIT